MLSKEQSKALKASELMRSPLMLSMRKLQVVRVLGQHREDSVAHADVAEADEERDRGVDHALGLGDHAGAAPEAGEPVPLAGMVALDPVGLVLADVEPALRDQLGVGRPVVGAVETRLPALHALDQPAQGGGVTTPALPVNHSP